MPTPGRWRRSRPPSTATRRAPRRITGASCVRTSAPSASRWTGVRRCAAPARRCSGAPCPVPPRPRCRGVSPARARARSCRRRSWPSWLLYFVVASHTSSPPRRPRYPTVVHQANVKRAEEAVNGLGTSGAAAGTGPTRGVKGPPSSRGRLCRRRPRPEVKPPVKPACASSTSGRRSAWAAAAKACSGLPTAWAVRRSPRVVSWRAHACSTAGLLRRSAPHAGAPERKAPDDALGARTDRPRAGRDQSLQDITAEYHAAAGRLAAARAERAALLRALAHADTPAAVESLHARLAGAAHQITVAEHRQAGVSRQASQAQVEVTVFGEPHHAEGAPR